LYLNIQGNGWVVAPHTGARTCHELHDYCI
jgi:hypothetical protein